MGEGSSEQWPSPGQAPQACFCLCRKSQMSEQELINEQEQIHCVGEQFHCAGLHHKPRCHVMSILGKGAGSRGGLVDALWCTWRPRDPEEHAGKGISRTDATCCGRAYESRRGTLGSHVVRKSAMGRGWHSRMPLGTSGGKQLNGGGGGSACSIAAAGAAVTASCSAGDTFESST